MVKRTAQNSTKTNRNKNETRKAATELLWQKSGFQRILGGYWHNYIFNLGILVFGLVMLGIIFPNYPIL